MKIVMSLIALVAFIAAPCGLGGYAAAETPAVKQPAAKKPVTATPAAKVGGHSPYSSNPEYDVYVNGEYVGSDPDPRIRASLRKEWNGRLKWY